MQPLFAYWVHDLDPFILRVYGEFGIRWYGAAYLLGMVAGYWLLTRFQAQRRLPLRRNEILDFVIVAAVAMMVGGRLGHSLLYNWPAVQANPLVIFQIWNGGMASHGGMIGFLVGIGLFARWRKRSFLVLLDAIVAVGPIGVIAGRIANFINGELWGRPTTVAWAVIFPKAPLIDGVNLPRHPSQLYAVVLEGVAVLATVMILHPRHRRPGLTTGAGAVVYSVGRFVGEFYREPDEGYGLFFGWMSKGQLYTLPLMALGIGLVIYALTRAPRPNAYLPPETVNDDGEVDAKP
jgi:phosphatidylglycerol:prolipoprotein diacylglycerol transferase